ncbi:unnamed protein product [Rangifer tarandus platyrhynchus]|uniref:Uncharacterized protein n=2 Tax=Rangifer tarandus platyrhynchus TaxID=3082113 RepID=A0ABN9A4N6_RANTA|nr:unnamed protein product [Rangifer tarandus platyrhynchus]
MEFSRQEYWSELPFPPPGDLADPGLNPRLLHLLHWQVGSLPLSHLGNPLFLHPALILLIAHTLPNIIYLFILSICICFFIDPTPTPAPPDAPSQVEIFVCVGHHCIPLPGT